MSVIDKKPFIVTLLDTLNADELKTLNNLINGNNNSAILRSLKKDTTYPLTVADKGIKEARIEIYGPSAQSIYNGYLIYTDDYCCLISYSSEKSTNLSLIEMNLTSYGWFYTFRTCGLTILELRSELNNRLIQAGAVIPENVKFTVTNIKALTDAQCNSLKSGDIIAKKTGNQYHTYVVSYNEKNHGLCLTYSDASVVETVSYDYIGGHWVYNSTDITPLAGSEIVEVSSSSSESETTIEITQAQYQKLLGDNVVLKVNNTADGSSLYMYKTNAVTEPDITIYSNILTNFSFSATVSQVETEGEPEYAVVITSQALGGLSVAVTGITSGDDLAGVHDDLVDSMKNHLEVEINGFRARYEYTSGNYVVYSSKAEADGGLKLQINMISLLIASPNTISFNQMTFTPDA